MARATKAGMNRRDRRREAKERTRTQKRVRRAATADPQAALAVAVDHHRAGRLQEAERLYRRLLEDDPDHADANHLLGVIALQTGADEAARELIERAVGRDPDVADYHGNLGLALQALGRLDEAAESFARALRLNPRFAAAHNNLGNVLKAQGRMDEAEAAYRRAIEVAPDYAEAHGNLGNALAARGRLEEAVPCYRRALGLDPRHARAHNNLGNALQRLGRLPDAIECYRRALEIAPDFAEAHSNLGSALAAIDDLDGAVESLERALRCNPEYGEAHNNLGNVRRFLGRLGEAARSYRRAIELDPGFAEAYVNLGNVLQTMGRQEEAEDSCRRALAVDPGQVDAHRSLLLAMLYNPDHDCDAIYDEQRRFETRFARPLYARAATFALSRDPDRRLRVGYLSSDFRTHPVAHNIEPLLRNHDRERIEVLCYADVANPDGTTAQFRSLADGWRDIAGKDDADVAATIRADRVDILVVLAGRFDKNRPLVCAHRPAPVQVSAHDGTTTGMTAVDYWLTDGFLHPPDTRERFTEELVRLPGFYVYPPIEDAPPVGPPPARRNEGVVFGCFNNPGKVTPEVVALWARVLRAVPGSRLAMKYKGVFGCPETRGRFVNLFAANGIGEDRLDFLHSMDRRRGHLALYDDIDIALDPFPFTGATTTFEALWMGVPVITLLGDRFVARASGSLLSRVGLEELVAENADAYVAIARGLAADLPRLEGLRAGLRDRVALSPLCDGERYARDVEAAYRDMWHRWCAKAAA